MSTPKGYAAVITPPRRARRAGARTGTPPRLRGEQRDRSRPDSTLRSAPQTTAQMFEESIRADQQAAPAGRAAPAAAPARAPQRAGAPAPPEPADRGGGGRHRRRRRGRLADRR